MTLIFRTTALCLLTLLLSGCISSILADTVIKAPNQEQVPRAVRDEDYRAQLAQIYAQEFEVAVGLPEARLSVAVIEPGNYQMTYRVVVHENQAGRKRKRLVLEWEDAKEEASPARSHGTVMVLHGYRDSKEDSLHWALALAEAGYRAVVVDFRGHGRSTGKVISYGAFEATDLVQVVDELEQRDLFQGKIGVMGTSYGGSVGLLLAAKDPRVATVVSLEPYSSAATGVVEFARGVAPSRTASISDEQFQAGLKLAEKRGGFKWSDADVLALSESITVPFFLWHGAKDTWVSPENSRRLIENAPKGSKLAIVKEDNHLSLALRLEPIRKPILDWFAEHLPADL